MLSANALIREGKRYDGKEVAVMGEAIGDVMRRKAGYWVNVLTRGGGAIGILADEKNARKISVTGDYTHRGDLVMVRGVMYAYAPKLGGETCIVADEIRVISRGYTLSHGMPWHKLFIGLMLTGISIVMWLMLRGYAKTGSGDGINETT